MDEAVLDRRDPTADLVGRLFGDRYRVHSLIGKGGMGWVFRAVHEAMQQTVALKVMRRDAARDLAAARRFYQEGRACSLLSHPHTIRVYDFGVSDDGHPYLVMEFLEGRSLEDVLSAEGFLAPARAARIGQQVCRSLHEAHEAGLVHRDLKPANVFLARISGEPEWVKVLDFGIAKAVRPATWAESLTGGMLVGTPRYMSPDQIGRRDLDGRSDLYSLGVMLFEMLSGQPPFVADEPIPLLVKHMNEPAPDLRAVLPAGRVVPDALCALVGRLLAKNPDHRPPSALAAAEALAPFAATARAAAAFAAGPSAVAPVEAAPGAGMPIADAVTLDPGPTERLGPLSAVESAERGPKPRPAPTRRRSESAVVPVPATTTGASSAEAIAFPRSRWPWIAGIAALGALAAVLVVVVSLVAGTGGERVVPTSPAATHSWGGAAPDERDAGAATGAPAAAAAPVLAVGEAPDVAGGGPDAADARAAADAARVSDADAAGDPPADVAVERERRKRSRDRDHRSAHGPRPKPAAVPPPRRAPDRAPVAPAAEPRSPVIPVIE